MDLLYQPHEIDEYGVLVKWYLVGENQSAWRETCPCTTLFTTSITWTTLGLCGEVPWLPELWHGPVYVLSAHEFKLQNLHITQDTAWHDTEHGDPVHLSPFTIFLGQTWLMRMAWGFAWFYLSLQVNAMRVPWIRPWPLPLHLLKFHKTGLSFYWLMLNKTRCWCRVVNNLHSNIMIPTSW
jgi:hypothetical protein